MITASSMMRKSVSIREDFPEPARFAILSTMLDNRLHERQCKIGENNLPVRPQTPTFWPPDTFEQEDI